MTAGALQPLRAVGAASVVVTAALGAGSVATLPSVWPSIVLLAAATVAVAGGLVSHTRGRTKSAERHIVERESRTARVTWWMHPGVLVLLMGLPAVLLSWRVSAGYYLVHWRTPKYFDEHYAVIALGLLAAFAFGTVLTSRGLGRRESNLKVSPRQLELLRRAGGWLFRLTVTGYGMWLLIALARGAGPSTISAIVGGNPGAVSAAKATVLKPVPGLTSLTQLGPVAAAVLVLASRLGEKPARRRLFILGALALVRTVLDAERLALVELLVPCVMIALIVPRASAKRIESTSHFLLRTAFPVILPVAIVLIFGTFEYVRSWDGFYRQSSHGESYASFTIDRLGAYYATAGNNSVIALKADDRQTAVPYYSLQWLWTFPVLGAALDYRGLAGADPNGEWPATLRTYGNPEFNNQGGLLILLYDFGTSGALVAWFALGAALGLLYARCRGGSVAALLVFAVVSTALFEVARIPYWSLGRSFPAIVSVLLVARLLRVPREEMQASRSIAMGLT